MQGEAGTVRIAAVGDLHCPRTTTQDLQVLFDALADHADVLLLCGDLTDYGKPEEARELAQQLPDSRRLPALAVLGNHEYECGQHKEVADILTGQGVTILDGTATVIKGIGFAGVKGFCGGFGERA